MGFYPAYICENGHAVEIGMYSFRDKYCTICGANIIHQCPACKTTIKGLDEDTGGFFTVPSYCRNCGVPFPWTNRAIAATLELLAEDENITTEECNRLSDVLPDIMTETPRTQLAAARLRKAMTVIGSITCEALKQFVIDFGCEAVKLLLKL